MRAYPMSESSAVREHLIAVIFTHARQTLQAFAHSENV